jgi:predicted metal-dependent peptidase
MKKAPEGYDFNCPPWYEEARLWAGIAAPYFSAGFMRLVPVFTRKIDTAAVSVNFVLYINPDLPTKGWTIPELGTLITHELIHPQDDHHERLEALGLKGLEANIAADLADNSQLLSAGCYALRPDWVTPDSEGMPRGLTLEEYAALREQRQQEQKAQQPPPPQPDSGQKDESNGAEIGDDGDDDGGDRSGGRDGAGDDASDDASDDAGDDAGDGRGEATEKKGQQGDQEGQQGQEGDRGDQGQTGDGAGLQGASAGQGDDGGDGAGTEGDSEGGPAGSAAGGAGSPPGDQAGGTGGAGEVDPGLAGPSEGLDGCCGSAAGWRHPCENDEIEEAVGRGAEEIEAIKDMVAQAIQDRVASRGIGSVPGCWARAAEARLAQPKVPWPVKLQSALRFCVGSREGAHRGTYETVDRRQGALDMVCGQLAPRIEATESPVPEVVWLQDTSGSMGTVGITRGATETAAVIKAVGGRIRYLAWDTKVQSLATISNPRDIAQHVKGGGGTNIGPAFSALAAMRPKPEVFINCTDGDLTGCPAVQPRGQTVIWLLVGARVRPCSWGIFIEIEEDDHGNR